MIPLVPLLKSDEHLSIHPRHHHHHHFPIHLLMKLPKLSSYRAKRISYKRSFLIGTCGCHKHWENLLSVKRKRS